MKLSKVFRKAAELVAANEEPYSCDAVLKAANGEANGAMFFWRDHFKPRDDSPEHYWLRYQGMSKNERIKWRILALCFASAIAKSEDL